MDDNLIDSSQTRSNDVVGDMTWESFHAEPAQQSCQMYQNPNRQKRPNHALGPR